MTLYDFVLFWGLWNVILNHLPSDFLNLFIYFHYKNIFSHYTLLIHYGWLLYFLTALDQPLFQDYKIIQSLWRCPGFSFWRWILPLYTQKISLAVDPHALEMQEVSVTIVPRDHLPQTLKASPCTRQVEAWPDKSGGGGIGRLTFLSFPHALLCTGASRSVLDHQGLCGPKGRVRERFSFQPWPPSCYAQTIA